jgi:hypothetical protein
MGAAPIAAVVAMLVPCGPATADSKPRLK